MYKGDRLISEQAETEMVTGLTELPEHRYGYSVSNGTIGVYEQDTRLWRVKVSLHLIFNSCIKHILYLSQLTPIATDIFSFLLIIEEIIFSKFIKQILYLSQLTRIAIDIFSFLLIKEEIIILVNIP